MSHRYRLAPVVAIAAIMLFAGSRPAHATLIVVPNATFQNPDVADAAFTDTNKDPVNAVPNWTFTHSGNGTLTAGVWDPASVDYTIAGGNNTQLPGTAQGGQAAYIFLEQTNPATPLLLSGDLTTSAPVAIIESETSYTLTVALGRAKNVPVGDVTVALTISGFPIAEVLVPAASITQDTFNDFSVNLTTFAKYPFAGEELDARVTHTYGGAIDASLDIDNVRFDVTRVPEPGTASAALLALGAVLPMSRRRRR